MAGANERRWSRPELWVEAFAILNIGFLTFDIYLAHSVNQFRNRAEYIPLLFSAIAPVILVVALTQRSRRRIFWKILGHVVGWSAIVVGLSGMILHLESSFFYQHTIRSITYSAPFAAPLAYTGTHIGGKIQRRIFRFELINFNDAFVRYELEEAAMKCVCVSGCFADAARRVVGE